MNKNLNELRVKISQYSGGMSLWCKAYGKSKPTFYLLFFRKKITKQQTELQKIGLQLLTELQKKTHVLPKDVSH